MLEAKFETLKKTFQRLSGIHSKCKSQQEKATVSTQTLDDEVTFTMYLINSQLAIDYDKKSPFVQYW